MDLDPAKRSIMGAFPRLQSAEFEITSPKDQGYNCAAHAAEDSANWWWPIRGTFWPGPSDLSIPAFILTFKNLGYERCWSLRLARGYKKVVIYVDTFGQPTHFARQLPDGKWTSKLGGDHDIKHDTLEALVGKVYGEPKVVLRKRTSERIHLGDYFVNTFQELFCRWQP